MIMNLGKSEILLGGKYDMGLTIFFSDKHGSGPLFHLGDALFMSGINPSIKWKWFKRAWYVLLYNGWKNILIGGRY